MSKSEIDRLGEQQAQFIEQLISASAGYWNALMTCNGLLLATLSIVVTIPGTPMQIWQFCLVVFTLFLNLAALLCILWCFRSQRDHYLELVRFGPEQIQSNVEMSGMKERTFRRHYIRKAFEFFSAATTIVSVLIVIVVVLCKQ